MTYIMSVFPWDGWKTKKIVKKMNVISGKITVIVCPVVDGRKSFSRKILRLLQIFLCLFPKNVLLNKVEISESDKVIYYNQVNHWESVWESFSSKGIKTIKKLAKLGNAWALYDYSFEKPELDYFEYHVSWHCNLKCKGCGHYSNLQSNPRFANFEQYKKDLSRLHELVQNIRTIKLLGGEPFLNPQLSEFVMQTRKEFPGAIIRVVSNGLLIPKIGDDVMKAIADNNATLEITQYPPTAKIVNQIEAKCKQFNIPLFVSPLVKEFFSSSDGSEIGDIQENWDRCEVKICHFLCDGYLAVCGAPIFVKEMADKIDYKGVVDKKDMINIYDNELTGEKLVELMNTPINFCKYCVKTRFFKWESGCREYFTDQMLKSQINELKG
ncbi:MAG: radical SAM protein [Lachnospiraceae bacterium]|nr:radical SAM protein [Lachnospiraceae bacterium]